MTFEETVAYVSLPQANEVTSTTNAPVLGHVLDSAAVNRIESSVTAEYDSHPSEVDAPESDSEAMALRSCHPSLTKTNVGAACVGAIVGLIFLGPIGMIIFAAAAGYATTYPEGNIGHYSRKIDDKAYSLYSSATKASTAKL